MQFLADMLDTRVDRPQITETTALGVAYLADITQADPGVTDLQRSPAGRIWGGFSLIDCLILLR